MQQLFIEAKLGAVQFDKRFTGFISIFQYIFKKKRSPAFAEWQVSKISGKNPSIELVDDTQLNRTMVM